ncbi:DUF2393 family protein [Sulfurimonas sp.]|uniref:DUF2393 family protein n=1 Tax=Sulfurimonas sp. TaxID=2022749 RepID=UPI0035670EB9
MQMTTLFNYWHYIVLAVILFIFIGGVVSAFKQTNKKLVFPMLVSVSLITVLMAGFSIVVVDKYTKIPKIYKLENKRLLGIEKIVYTGIVKNEGNHEIGTVTIEIKLVNKGHATGNVKGGNFYKPSGFMDFFSGGADILYKPQTIVKEFVVATNLKPGEAKAFRVYFGWPPYFRSVAEFVKIMGH